MAYGYVIKVRETGRYLLPPHGGKYAQTTNADEAGKSLTANPMHDRACDLSRVNRGRTFEVWSLEDSRLCAVYLNGSQAR